MGRKAELTGKRRPDVSDKEKVLLNQRAFQMEVFGIRKAKRKDWQPT